MKIKRSQSHNVDPIHFALKRLIDRGFPPDERSSFHNLILNSIIVFSGKVISLPDVLEILRFGKRDSEETYIPCYSSMRLAQTLIARMDFDKHVRVPLATAPGWVFFSRAIEYKRPVVLNPKSDITLRLEFQELESLSKLALSHFGHSAARRPFHSAEPPSSLPFSYSYDMFRNIIAPTSSKADIQRFSSQVVHLGVKNPIEKRPRTSSKTIDVEFQELPSCEQRPSNASGDVISANDGATQSPCAVEGLYNTESESSGSSNLCTIQEAAAVLAVNSKTFIKNLKKIEKNYLNRGPLYFDVPRLTKKGAMSVLRYYTMEAVALVGQRIRGPKGDGFRDLLNQLGQEKIKQAEKIILESRGDNIPLISHEFDLEMRRLKKDINDISQSNTQLAEELSEKNRLILDLQNTIKGITSQAHELQATLGEAIEDYKPPKTVIDACIEAQKVYGSKLIFLDSVSQTLKNWPHNTNFRMALAAQARFRAMATHLWSMVFASESRSIDPQKFLELSGFKLALGEGKLTNQDNALTKLRTCEYEGEEVDFSPHLKARVGKTAMRIHFFVDRIKQVLVLCHVGGHIPNALSRKL